MRVVVLISGSGSNLQALIDGAAEQASAYQIVGVISNVAEVKGLTRAADAGIKHEVISHRDFVSRESFDQALQDHIESFNPDLVVLAGFMRILTADFVTHFASKLINIHPSLLPNYPGTRTHQRALDNNDRWHGASVHFVTPEVDAGPIILQGRLEIGSTTDANELAKRVLSIEHSIYPQALQWLSQNRVSIKNHTVLLDGETSPAQLQTFNA